MVLCITISSINILLLRCIDGEILLMAYENEYVETIYEMIQNFLKYTPTIIWGSGATIKYGLPTMIDLSNFLKVELDYFNNSCTNLEEELRKDIYEPHIAEIRQKIKLKKEYVQQFVR